MFKIILALVMFIAHSWVMAQAVERRKTVTCDSAETIFRALIDEFRETPVWFARDISTPTQYVIFANDRANTWTLIQYDATQACILGTGTGSRFPPVGQPV